MKCSYWSNIQSRRWATSSLKWLCYSFTWDLHSWFFDLTVSCGWFCSLESCFYYSRVGMHLVIFSCYIFMKLFFSLCWRYRFITSFLSSFTESKHHTQCEVSKINFARSLNLVSDPDDYSLSIFSNFFFYEVGPTFSLLLAMFDNVSCVE